MGPAVGQSLPIAVGVLISPMPIVAVVLMLVSRKAKANGFSFLLGWIVGIAALGSIVLLVAGAATPDASGPPAWASVVKIVLGVLLLLLAVSQWRGRPREGASPQPPRWMSAIDAFTPVKAFGLAVLLGAVNPKNLLLVVSGAAAIAAATPETSEQLGALAVFVVVASLGVAAPVAIYLAMGSRAATLLDGLKAWMIQNNAVIMAVLLLVLGAKMIGDGITAL
ncbi:MULTISPECIES: GAP family protein [Oerskovia]|uniref:GAP family protein n=2 Tax=Oerskovia TaxID=162491 RepID=A0ABR8V1N8_9CELL|nr:MULTISPECIES: GAP family protein [Oerskovia]MBD7998689.1 GAP family protein [Oerskovia gallyi]MBM7497391.1 threonine/homoserine/homoserine lactone efflux protein [Oerskovia paurometabola]